MKNIAWLLTFLLLGGSAVQAQKDYTFKKLNRLSGKLREISGLYIENENRMWGHNDSGSDPVIWAFDASGNIVDSIYFHDAPAVDWEDITHDDEGNIYVGDFGNNRNKRQDLAIYKYSPKDGSVSKIAFSYADQTAFAPEEKSAWNFDCEGFAWHNDSLYLFSKNKMSYGNYYTKMYVLPDKAGTYEVAPRDSILLEERVITAAAISPDGSKIAWVTYDLVKFMGLPRFKASLIVSSGFEDDNFLQGKLEWYRLPKHGTAMQYEAVDWLNNDTMYIGAEMSWLFGARIDVFQWNEE